MQQIPLEFSEYITPDGETYQFDTYGDKFWMSTTGMGMPPVRYISQQGPLQHGQTIYDYRLEPRIIQLVHRRNACSRQDYWDNRTDLMDYLRPNRQVINTFGLGTLRKQLPDGTQRDIDVMIEQGPMFRASDQRKWDEWGITETLRFIAPDPTFYDPSLETETWVLSPDTQNNLVFPFTFDGTNMVFRMAALNEDHVVSYTGTWLAYPTIEITGPLLHPRITNESTGEQVYLKYEVESGEVVTITMAYENKSVSSDSLGDIIGVVADTSDLATFHIAPDPEVADGTNTLNVSGGGADGTTAVEMTYYTRYIGI